MDDSKIYIKDLPNIFKVNYSLNNEKKIKNNIIEKKIITFKKIKKKINTKKEILNEKNISINNTNNIILQKIMLTPEQRKKELKHKKFFHFNSTLLSQKRMKMFNPTLINANIHSNSIHKEKNIPQKQKIFIPSIGNTIININNNYFSEISKTERFYPQKLRKFTSIHSNYNTLQNSSREIENRLISNKLSLTNKKNIKSKQHISHDFSYKKRLNNRANNKIVNNNSTQNKRTLSPQLIELNILNKINKNSGYTKNHLMNKKIKKNEIAITINAIHKSKEKMKRKEIKNKNKDNILKINNKENILKNNNKLFTLKNKNKLSINEFSLLSFINIAKTESNTNQKTKNKKCNKFKEKQKTCFNFLKNNIKKKQILLHKLYTSYRNGKEKNRKFIENNNLNKKHISNNSFKSDEKIKNMTKNNSIKNKTLKSETRYPFKKYITNYINRTKIKDSNGIINNFIDYSTIVRKKHINKNIKNLLMDSKSIEKKKKNESLDFSSSDYCIHRKFFPKFDSTKRNSYIYSPKNSFSNIIKSKNKINKIVKDYLTERSIKFNQTIIPKRFIYTVNQNELKNKYKSIILKKNNKKSYDFNSDIFKRYNQNILNKINNLKNTNKNYNLSKIKEKSYSIDLNILNYNNKYNSYNYKNKEKDKKNNGKDLFKKIMNFKNDNKTEEKISKVNNSQNNNIPITIKVNTKKFLSKIKEKYKNIDNKY